MPRLLPRDMKSYGDHRMACLLARTTQTPDGCWLWAGSQAGAGYGYAWWGGRLGYTHRWSYAYYKGPIPTDCEVDHLCKQRLCLNPAHLEAVPHRINIWRGDTIMARNKAKQVCSRGHAFTQANTYLTKAGHRCCRACGAMHAKERRRLGLVTRRRSR